MNQTANKFCKIKKGLFFIKKEAKIIQNQFISIYLKKKLK